MAVDVLMAPPDEAELEAMLEAACTLGLVDKCASVLGEAMIAEELVTFDMALDVGFSEMLEEAG